MLAKTLGFGALALVALIALPAVSAAPQLDAEDFSCAVTRAGPYNGAAGAVQTATQLAACSVADIPAETLAVNSGYSAVIRPAVHPDGPVVGCLIPEQVTFDARPAAMPAPTKAAERCLPSGASLSLGITEIGRKAAEGDVLQLQCAQVYPMSAMCDLPFGPLKVVVYYLGLSA